MSNRHLAEQFADTLNKRDEAAYAALLHPDYHNHNTFAAPGKAGSVDVFFRGFLVALPDFRVSALDVFEDGDTLIGRFAYSGTFLHPLIGYSPTGQAVQMRSIDIWRVQGGLLVEHWDELNTLEVFTQLGAARLLSPAQT
jgi:predicted SnoaL-like aldol condensation-catalyzing enzyme